MIDGIGLVKILGKITIIICDIKIRMMFLEFLADMKDIIADARFRAVQRDGIDDKFHMDAGYMERRPCLKAAVLV